MQIDGDKLGKEEEGEGKGTKVGKLCREHKTCKNNSSRGIAEFDVSLSLPPSLSVSANSIPTIDSRQREKKRKNIRFREGNNKSVCALFLCMPILESASTVHQRSSY